jgi:hypothetical protein
LSWGGLRRDRADGTGSLRVRSRIITSRFVGPGFAGATRVARPPDGKNLVVGSSYGPLEVKTVQRRYEPDGRLDPTSGDGGLAEGDGNDPPISRAHARSSERDGWRNSR